MRTPESVSCHLACDLFIPYLAAEVSPETRTWLEAHLAECESCRAEFANLSSPTEPTRTPAPDPSADPGRRVLGRVRVWALGLTGVAVFSLALVAAILLWIIPTMRTAANMPANHPAPAAGVSPQQAVRQDLTALGLTLSRVYPTPNGAIAQYRDAAGHVVQLEAFHFATEAEAVADYRGWYDAFSTHFMSVQFDRSGGSAVKFQSGDSYFYAWRTGTWFIDFTVPKSVPSASHLRDQIRDALISAYAQTQG